MRIIKIWGGFGNQMFQYAFYRALKKKDKESYVELTWFNNKKRDYYYDNQIQIVGLQYEELQRTDKFYHSENEYELLRLGRKKGIGIIPQIIYAADRGIRGGKLSPFVVDNPYLFDKKLCEIDNAYYVGYWQNNDYYVDVIDEISQGVEIEKNISITTEMRSIMEKMEKENSVCVHVRRSDYQFEQFNTVCNASYYNKAIDVCRNQLDHPHFYIFSNKINDARELLGEKDDYSYVDFNDRMNGLMDLAMMVSCHNNIISNSSYSWWSAVLNKHVDKTVIAPQRWKQADKDFNLFFNEWIEV